MTIPQSYLASRKGVEQALADDGMTLDDFDATVFGMVHDGECWQLLEDSLEPAEALEWAKRAEGYGEVVGLFQWDPRA